MIHEDASLRRRIIERQQARVEHFLEPRVRRQFFSYLEQIEA